EVQLEQVFGGPHLRVLLRMPEPPRPDRHVRLAGTPYGAVRVAVLQGLGDPRPGQTGIRDDRRIDRGPVGISRDAALVADPANVGTCIREHDRGWLESADGLMEARPVILLSTAIRALP